MSKSLPTIALVIVVLIVVLFKSAFFTVNEWEKALKFYFGEFSGEELQPGWHLKFPLANTIQKYDIRIQTMDKAPEKFFTVKKEELLIDSFVKWRVENLQQYFKSVNNKARAENRLQQKVNNSLKEQIAKRTISEVIAGDRTEIMEFVQQAVDEEAKSIGIKVIDVRLKRVDLADEIQDNVFNRMRTERERIAKEKRATGSELAESIRANAEKQKEITLAEAVQKSEVLRGTGDAVATQVYANTFGKDQNFFELYRSLNAYKKTFDSGDDLMVIDPNSDFFKYFKSDQ